MLANRLSKLSFYEDTSLMLSLAELRKFKFARERGLDAGLWNAFTPGSTIFESSVAGMKRLLSLFLAY